MLYLVEVLRHHRKSWAGTGLNFAALSSPNMIDLLENECAQKLEDRMKEK